MKSNTTNALMSLVAALSLVACGGGGNEPTGAQTQTTELAGDTALIATPTLNHDVSTITPDNAGLVAYTALTSTKTIGELLSTAAVVKLIGASLVLDFGSIAGDATNGTAPCEGGGKTSWRFIDSDGDEAFSSGDRYTTNANNCVDEYNDTTSGTVSMDFIYYEPDYSGDIVLELALDTHGTFIGQESATKGSFSFKTATVDGGIAVMTIETEACTDLSQGKTTSVEDFYFSAQETEELNGEQLSFRGHISDSDYGEFFIETHTPLVGIDIPLLGGTEYYHDGSYTVTANDKTSVTLTAISRTDVILEIDSDGDGVNEQSTSTTWESIVGELLTELGVI